MIQLILNINIKLFNNIHKSIIFLLGLLVFFIPIGPSSMSNSNAMAVEDYEYEETDQYDQYATDMANDKYYKSQNSDFIKKIKCNNINSNFNGVEANIGTGDSLGGIGSESLQDDASANWLGNGERNNGNFDLDCINNNNNEGGIGTVGPPDPPGPPGLVGIDPTKLYRAFGFLNSTSPIDGTATSTATCNPGDIVYLGSYFIGNAEIIDIVSDGPTNEFNGWEASITELDVQDAQVRAFAVCFDNP